MRVWICVVLTVLEAAPARDDAHPAEEALLAPGVCPGHADGHHVRLPLYRALQLQDRDVVLEGGRLVVLVDHHSLHLHTGDVQCEQKQRFQLLQFSFPHVGGSR